MKPRSQQGQALPTVLAIMLVLVLLAGGATMAVSAVLRQQDSNRAITTADVSSQNAVAATAANIAACTPAASPLPLDSLFQYDFKSSKIGLWRFVSGSGVVQPNGLMLAPSSVIVPLDRTNAEKWSDYSVSVQLRPTSISGTGPELDAYSHENRNRNGLTSHYYLQQSGGSAWTFGVATVSRNGVKTSKFDASTAPVPYGTKTPETLELDLFDNEITAKINDKVVARHLDNSVTPIPNGSIAVTGGASQLEVDSVHVDQLIPPPTPQVHLLSPSPFPSAGIPDAFYCQRLENISTAAVSQQRVAVSNVSSCTDLGAPIGLPDGVAGHVKIWFIVPWPSGTKGSMTMALGGCPTSNDIEPTDCSRQRSTLVPGTTLMAVAADCTNIDPATKPGKYDVFLSLPTTYRGNPLIDVRSAPSPGNGSVYMTVMAVPTAGGRSYEESDILMPQGVLSYEGVLG
jgi:hypothetical protein